MLLEMLLADAARYTWTALGLRLPTPDSVMQISMCVLFPLTFASNVFVDPGTMPGWVQAFVNVNPISHLATTARGLMHGAGGGPEVLWVLLWSAGLVAVFAPLTMRSCNAER